MGETCNFTVPASFGFNTQLGMSRIAHANQNQMKFQTVVTDYVLEKGEKHQ